MDLRKYWWQITIIALLAVVIAMLATFIVQQNRIKTFIPEGDRMHTGMHQPNPNPDPEQDFHFEHQLRHELDISDSEIEALREKRNEFHMKMQKLNQQIANAEHELMQMYVTEEMDSNKINNAKKELGDILVERNMLRFEYMKTIRECVGENKVGKLDSLMDQMMRKNGGKHSPGSGPGMGMGHGKNSPR